MERIAALRGQACAFVRPAVATVIRAVAIGTALAVVAIGCGSDQSAAPRLVDGSAPPRLPAGLRDVDKDAVPTRVRVLRATDLDARSLACLQAFRPEFPIPPATVIVERTGAIGASLTFRDARSRVVLGCDRTGRTGDAGRPWCARSVGRLFGGRLRDPRVDILCRSTGGDRVGFGWVEPATTTRWIVTHSGSLTEVAEVAAGLPVRVATTDVDITTSSATFEAVEYDANGKEVRRNRVAAAVAG